MCEEYNGWTNRETWAAALWIDNDRGLYETVQDMAKTSLEEHSGEEWDGISPIGCFAESIESLFDDIFADIAEMSDDSLTMLKEIGSLYRVNWREIATYILDELQVQA